MSTQKDNSYLHSFWLNLSKRPHFKWQYWTELNQSISQLSMGQKNCSQASLPTSPYPQTPGELTVSPSILPVGRVLKWSGGGTPGRHLQWDLNSVIWMLQCKYGYRNIKLCSKMSWLYDYQINDDFLFGRTRKFLQSNHIFASTM